MCENLLCSFHQKFTFWLRFTHETELFKSTQRFPFHDESLGGWGDFSMEILSPPSERQILRMNGSTACEFSLSLLLVT